ncbi:DUF3344 domain-containing protein [Methanofollis aquaemaris]|uniref:DUF3344 domain-containing protein n=2 Tax=Methanofollis aquaemaris TaxID=126734 RepID=A0A8A3S863_9EURY|nr:DUF3344 domain-containing protein [Methanofollis aquaemaris]
MAPFENYFSGGSPGGDAPVANFTANVTSGAAPLVVQFTDLSVSNGNCEERVTNGGFETGDVSGWTITGTDEYRGEATSSCKYSGTYALYLKAGDPEEGTFSASQTIDLTHVDAITFWSYLGQGAPHVKIDNTDVVTDIYDFSWTEHTIDTSNYSGNHTLTFYLPESSPDINFYVDDISAVSGGITAWSWNFGDNATSTEQNPMHTYTSAGNYTVSLTAANATGSDSEVKTDYITVSSGGGGDAPVANFTANVTSGTAPLAVQFTDLSVSNGSSEERVTNGGFETGDITGWTITGTDEYRGEATSSCKYSGTYALYLKAGDPEVGTFSASQTVDLTGVDAITFWSYLGQGAPHVKIDDTDVVTDIYDFSWTEHTIDTSNYSGNHTLTFYLPESSPNINFYVDDISAVSGGITAWSWNFGDNATSTEQNPVHTYMSAGDYTVSLTAANATGNDSETKTDYITVSAAAQVDLTISGTVNTVPASAIFAREPNAVRIASVKNNGPDAASNITVAVYASDVANGTAPVNTTTIDSLASGATSTVTLIDPTIRNLEGGTVTYTAAVDPANLIAETDESNNNKISAAKSVKYNGYKGKGIYWDGGSNITTQHTYDLRGDVVSSTQPEDSYKSVGWTDRTETWTAGDLPIPRTATVEKVLLYVSYNWDQTPGGLPNLTATFNGNTVMLGTPYMDKSNFGAYADYEYGLYAVDVTSLFDPIGNNTLVTTPNTGNKNALYPSTLVVVYSDPNATRKQIFINEECDELGYSKTSYGTTMEEATAYVPFTGMAIDTADVQNVTLYSFVGSAGPDEGNLIFNGNVVATNAWQGTLCTASAQIFDVTSLLNATENVAAVQSTSSGGMVVLQQILVVEYDDSQN